MFPLCYVYLDSLYIFSVSFSGVRFVTMRGWRVLGAKWRGRGIGEGKRGKGGERKYG
jgi:hypothetical protein